MEEKICFGLVLSLGNKSDLEGQIKRMGNDSGKRLRKARNILSTTKRNTPPAKARKLNLDLVLNDVNLDQEENELFRLKKDLESKEQEVKDLNEKVIKLEAENTAFQEKIRLSSSENIDIGNGVFLNKEFLNTIKATSGTPNIFGRTLFKKIFELHEVIGYSLMGKGCNANKSDKLPSIDARRRDALIDYTLKIYGAQFGTKEYLLGKKDLKRSLASLILEMNKESREVEMSLQNLQ